jgi:hypothetical protein
MKKVVYLLLAALLALSLFGCNTATPRYGRFTGTTPYETRYTGRTARSRNRAYSTPAPYGTTDVARNRTLARSITRAPATTTRRSVSPFDAPLYRNQNPVITTPTPGGGSMLSRG